MKQGDLFIDGLPKTTANQQRAQLERVGGAIGADVLAFCRARIGSEFRMEELRDFVGHRGHRAPDSSGRILRLLRQHGMVKYEVVNRAQSLYRVESA